MKNKNNKKLIIIITVIASVLTGIALLGYTFYRSSNEDGVATVNSGELTDYSPPTEDEKQSGNIQKELITQQEETRNKSTESIEKDNRTIDILITDAGQYDNIIEIRAFTPNYYKDGTCKFTLKQGTNKIERSTPAYRDASTTICTNPMIQRSDIPSAGEWEAVVHFTDGSITGKSQSKIITIK